MENIKIICVKSTSNIFKGCIYEINKITSIRQHSELKKYYIDGINIPYTTDKYFKPLNNINLKTIDDFDNSKGSLNDYSYKNCLSYNLNNEDISNEKLKGLIVKCGYNNSKYLVKGNFYTIIDFKTCYNFGGKVIIDKVKINNNRNQWYSGRNFYFVNKKIQRKLKLNKLTSGNEITNNKRKFLNYSKNKKIQIILELLASISKKLKIAEDTKNLKLTNLIVELGNKHNIINEDLKEFEIILSDFSKKLNISL